jgi:hypothetical protein
VSCWSGRCRSAEVELIKRLRGTQKPEYRLPAACAGRPLPASIRGQRERACGLFDDAAGTTDRKLGLKRLRRAVGTLKESIRVVSRAGKNAISRDCADALKGELRDAKERAERLLATLRARR